jgi:DNA polymerase-3 subunit epsilon
MLKYLKSLLFNGRVIKGDAIEAPLIRSHSGEKYDRDVGAKMHSRGICELTQVLPSRRFSDFGVQYKKDTYVKNFDIAPIDPHIQGLKINMRATLTVSGAAEINAEEAQRCFLSVASFFREVPKESLNKLQQNQSVSVISPKITNDPVLKGFVYRSALELGPLIKAIRARIKELRKQKLSHSDELEALKNSIYLLDLSAALELKGVYLDSTYTILKAHQVLEKNELTIFQSISSNFKNIGYEKFSNFNKTDIKWMTEQYGVPDRHASPDDLVYPIKSRLIQKHYQQKLNEKIQYQPDLTLDQLVMDECVMFMRYHKHWYHRVKQKSLAEINSLGNQAAAKSHSFSEFIVADLETTGLDANNDQIIEIGAILCNERGEVLDKFQALINPEFMIDLEIQKLTGITNELLSREGRSMREVMNEFKKFIGNHPVFFHNAEFDAAFIQVGNDKLDLEMDNLVFDTLAIARMTWAHERSHSLSNLCKMLGISSPQHRALGDAEAALKVLVAAHGVRNTGS